MNDSPSSKNSGKPNRTRLQVLSSSSEEGMTKRNQY